MSANRRIYVSVTTCSHSGATLLAFLLGTHPQIATVGAMAGLIPGEVPEEYLCSCGKEIRVCEFWASVRAAMMDRGQEFGVARFDTKYVPGGPPLVWRLRMGCSTNRALNALRDVVFRAWPGETRRRRTWVARNAAFIDAVLQVTSKSVFVDTSKNRYRLTALQESSSFDVRAIHLVRDVRGVANSRLRRTTGLSARDAARQWVRENRKLELALRAIPRNKRIFLRYEDLCRDVHGTHVQLFDLCGVDPSVELADYRAVSHHTVGNPMRLGTGSGIALAEHWKQQLTGSQVETLGHAAASFYRRYGYRRGSQ